MKRKKKSNVLLILILAILLIQSIAFTFYVSQHTEKKPPQRRNVWLLAKGSYFKDTIIGSYSHLYTDFPLTEITGQSKNMYTIEGYENGRKYLKTQIRNDTLFVNNALPNSDTIVVAVDGDYPILVTIGANSLKSITINNQGRIDIPVNPYGSNPGGNIVYKPEDWNKYVLRSNTLNLTLLNGANSEFFFEIDTVNLHIYNQLIELPAPNSFGSVRNYSNFTGNVKKLNILNPHGSVLLNAIELSSDTVIIKSSPEEGHYDLGTVIVKCNDYLEARLLYNMDVTYSGEPLIVKKEKDFGRVIKNSL